MKKRTALGIVFAPLAAPLCYYFGVLVLSSKEIESFGHFISGLLITSVFALPVSYLASIIFGLPAVYLLRKYNRLNIWNLTLSATVLGALIFFTFILVGTEYAKVDIILNPELIWFMLSGGAMASSVAISFWYISGISTESE